MSANLIKNEIDLAFQIKIDYLIEKIGSRGGAIALSKTGFGHNFNTKRLSWCQKSDQNGFFGKSFIE